MFDTGDLRAIPGDRVTGPDGGSPENTKYSSYS